MPGTSIPAALPDHASSVSIVLATNRDSPYLEEALDSVRKQTVTDWELLIVDNGIADVTHVERLILSDERMSMIRIDSSATAGLARNVGVANTTGRLVTYLDDDDVWAPHRLEKHLAIHARFPDAPASYSGYWHMDAEGRHFGKDWRAEPADEKEMLKGAVDTPLGPTVMVRRDVYLAIGGFSPEIPILVDFEFALRLALQGQLVYIDDLLVGYRRHSSNMTSTAPDNARRRRHVMEQMVDRQRWAAAGRGDEATAALFEERLRRFRENEARAAGPAIFRSLRRGHVYDAAEQAGWGLSRAPMTFLASASAAPFAKARRLMSGG